MAGAGTVLAVVVVTMLMNLGCGPDIVDGWVNVDVLSLDLVPGVDDTNYLCHDMREPFPFADHIFDGVLMNHSLQQVRDTEVKRVLENVHDMLRPGGAVRILVPDVVAAFRAWERMDLDWPGFAAIADDDLNVDRLLTRYLTWNGTNTTCFTLGALGHELAMAGYVRAIDDGSTSIVGLDALDTRPGESLIIEAVT